MKVTDDVIVIGDLSLLRRDAIKPFRFLLTNKERVLLTGPVSLVAKDSFVWEAVSEERHQRRGRWPLSSREHVEPSTKRKDFLYQTGGGSGQETP